MEYHYPGVLRHRLANDFYQRCIMADRSDNDSDAERNFEENNFLINEIKRLEREKADMERKNQEKEILEQKLRELKGSISALKGSSGGLPSPPFASGSGNGRKSSPIGLNEAYNKLKNKLDTSVQYEEEQSDSNNESKSSDEEEEEEVMTVQHKQKIQKHRDTLVENLIPDDIFNDLIAGKILTTADVSRIKKKSTREAINEELLNNLVLKSDRAFFVFTKALKKTLQEYLSNLLEPPPKKKKRKRQQREMNISLDVDHVTPYPYQKRYPSCSCEEVEEQILNLSKNAYRNIRRRDQTASSFEQFRKELQSTNAVIKDSMEIINTLKLLCRHGDMNGITRGSVKFTMRFSSRSSLNKLWSLFQSGELLQSLQSTLVTSQLLEYFNLKDIKLGVRINEDEYQACIKELSFSSNNLDASCKKKMKISPQIEPNPSLDIENSPSPKTIPVHQYGTRKAFHELQKNIICNDSPDVKMHDLKQHILS